MIYPIIPHKPIQIESTLFLSRVSIWPPSGFGIVISVAVVVEFAFFVPVFGAKTKFVGIGVAADTGNSVTEGVVLVVGCDGSALVKDFCDIAVGIASVVIEACVLPGVLGC